MRIQYEQAIYEEMKKNDRVIALVADSGTGTYQKIMKEMPERYIDFGIAENTMFMAASGLASQGWIPVIYAINNFLVYRSYEFIRNDLCIDKRNVKVVGLGAGVIQNLQGPTHHTLEDISCLRALPNLTLLSPGTPKEVRGILHAAIEHEGPVYIRLAKMYETEVFDDVVPDFTIGGYNVPHEGTDITVFATGSIMGDAYTAAKELEQEHISVNLVNVNSLKPMNRDGIIKEAKKTGKVITLEEHNIEGGLGSMIAENLLEAGVNCKFRRMGFRDEFCRDYGWHQDLKKEYRLSPEHIADACREMVKEG
jgi:transketolase